VSSSSDELQGGETADDTAVAVHPPHKKPPLERGASVGRYLIVSHLGSGGMGVVYQAFDPDLGRTVALKLINTKQGASAVLRDRLMREAQALARLSHPNVVAVHDVGTFGDNIFIAMEFVEGDTLRRWLDREPRRQGEILAVFRAAGAGLAAAHRASLAHRDFKPDNVIVGADGRVCVLDFGLARDVHAAVTETPAPVPDSASTPEPHPTPTPVAPTSDPLSDSSHSRNRLSSSLTRTGTIMGTPRFMAPEQYRGQVVDERADQFSFCVSLYRALYGRFPFAGADADAYEQAVLSGRVEEPPPGSRVPRWIRLVLLRGLAVKPEDRWPSLEALLGALARDPARALRRRLSIAGAALGGLALLFAVGRAQRAQRLVCAGAEAKLQSVWDAATKDRMRAAFGKSGRPYAEDAFARTSAVLDGYAHDWAAMRTSACEATRLRGEQSEELLDLRMECLDQRGRELRELGELLAGADAALVDKAEQAAESLTPLSECANTAALKSVVRLPRDPAALAKVNAVRDRIARGKALFLASRLKDGLAWMTSVAEEAKGAHHPSTEAEALTTLALLQWRAGDTEHAESNFKSALFAAESGKDDETAARDCIFLVRTWVDQQPRAADGLFWAQNASAWASRLGGSVPKVDFELEEALGALYWGRAQFPEARAHYERALALAQKRSGPEGADVSTALGDLSLVLWDMDQLEESVAFAERGLAIVEKTRGPTHPAVGQALNQVSMGMFELGRLDESEKALLRARAIMEPFTPASDPWIGMVQGGLAENYKYQGRFDDSLRLLRATLPTQTAPDIVGYLQTEIGAVLNRQGKPAEALPWLEKGLAVKEKAYGSEHRDLAETLLGLGLARLALAQPAPAIAALERADKLPNLPRRVHGLVRVALARALEAGRRGDTARVRTLMTQARSDLSSSPILSSAERAIVDAWLARHPG
jgi:tetratricopeptide (TPR) repeat protein